MVTRIDQWFSLMNLKFFSMLNKTKRHKADKLHITKVVELSPLHAVMNFEQVLVSLYDQMYTLHTIY